MSANSIRPELINCLQGLESEYTNKHVKQVARVMLMQIDNLINNVPELIEDIHLLQQLTHGMGPWWADTKLKDIMTSLRSINRSLI